MRSPAVLAAILVLLAPAARAQEPSTDSTAALLGRFEDGRYVSPDGGFSLAIPAGSAATLRISDRHSGAREFVVSLTDQYCRQVLVIETRGELDAHALGAWVSTQVVARMDPERVHGLDRRRDSTRLGPVEWLEWTSPRMAPCEEIRVVRGRAGDRVRPDAGGAMAVFTRPGRIYRVIYLVGLGGQGEVSDGIRRHPAGVVLREILEGFEPGEAGVTEGD